MKKGLKIFLGLVLFIAIAGSAALIYLLSAFPDVQPAPESLQIEATPERIKRGEYLANNVAVCIDCHSGRDWSKLSGPVIKGTEGKGGEVFPAEMGFPGTFYAKNITPAALSGWTDGEIYRAISSGVSKDGSPLFPVMPYHSYGSMAKEDIYSIIAYLRTLEPIENKVPESEPDFPFSLILRTLPKNPNHMKVPKKENVLEYGKYIFTASGCAECHTPTEKGEKIKGMELAGGFEFPVSGGTVRSSNITPHMETGIGSWSKDIFISKFKNYQSEKAKEIKVSNGGFNTLMPWTMYAGMTEEDLGAVYEYLMSVKPVDNKVVKFTPNQ